MAIRPEVTIRTTADHDGGQVLAVVAGYGTDPAAAVRSLSHCARAEARGHLDGHPGGAYEVIDVTLVSGQIPDDAGMSEALAAAQGPAERAAVRKITRPGWAAYGTLIMASAGAPRRAAS